MQISEISAQGELWISLYEAFDSAILCVPRPQAFHKISLLAAWILILGKGKFRLVAKKNVRKIWSTETSGPSGSNPEFVLPQLRPRHADHSRVSPVLECERPWRGYPMTTALLSLATKSFMMLHGTFEQVSTRLMCSRNGPLEREFLRRSRKDRKAKKSHAFAVSEMLQHVAADLADLADLSCMEFSTTSVLGEPRGLVQQENGRVRKDGLSNANSVRAFTQ